MTVDDQLDARFRATAIAEGLVDVRYDVIDSPVGELAIARTDRGLCRISYGVDGFDDELARAFGVRVLRAPLDDVRRELDEYFDGTRRDFDLPLDLRVAPFHEEVLAALATRPVRPHRRPTARSRVRSGTRRAARAVGTVMNRNPIPIVLPCHRVIGANGSLTGYAGGLDRKRLLLQLEGATLPV